MADSITPERRSWNMSRIRNRDTSIEVRVRKALFAEGFRFRKNDKRLPGKPDVVLPKYKTVIFINGCFWHQHPGCKYARLPKSNVDYWQPKLERNMENDKRHYDELVADGWNVIVLWECELKKDFDEVVEQTIEEIKAA